MQREGSPLDDVLGAFLHLVATPSIQGPVNIVAPECPTQAQFAGVLGRVLSRPSFMPLPAAAVKLACGEMGERALLEGAFVTPRVLTETGYTWVHPTLEDALRFELGRAASR
jgi:NAD dependent epimerase/dehydratase family enzyme